MPLKSTPGPDRGALARLAKNDSAVNAIIRFADTRDRTRNGTVRSLRTELRKALNERLSGEDICAAIGRLEAIGYASLTRRKDIHESKIEWKRSLKDLVKDSKLEKTLREEGAEGERVPDGDRSAGSRRAVEYLIPDGLIAHRFRVRPDCEVILHLPDDLSQREAERIASFVRTVAYAD